jgi:hypothetical protein
MLRHRMNQKATADIVAVMFLHGSYVGFLHRKNRARLITYRHSEMQHLKNAFGAPR